jgi:ammonium transporter, Amt family
MHWTGLGVLILWLCWWGFNGGSTLALDERVSPVIVNTNLGASFGGFGALLTCMIFEKKRGVSGKFLNGILAGLVGITAGCHLVTPLGAVAVGLTSGAVSVLGTALLLKLKVDDPVGAISVHLFCGVWGTLCVGIFGKLSHFPAGQTRLGQIGVQLAGVVAVALWTTGTGALVFLAIRRWVGLRVSPREEQMGFDIGGAVAPAEELDEADLRRLLGERS